MMGDKQEIDRLEAVIYRALAAKDHTRVRLLCEQLNRQHPDNGHGWFVTSQVALRLNNAGAALIAVDRALAIDPEHVGWCLQRALCLASLGQAIELEASLTPLIDKVMPTAYQATALAALLGQVGLHHKALVHYQRAVDLEPCNSRCHYNIACVQRALGNINAAEHHFDQNIRLDPGDYEAYKLRSDLRTWSADNNHISELENLWDAGDLDPRGRLQICFALAKECEDIGDYRRSFEYLRTGADIRRGMMNYDVTNDINTMRSIRRTYTSDVFDRGIRGHDSHEPIFIVGMPRTGTTLVERILASHSAVCSAGELTNFATELMRLAGPLARTRNLTRDEMVAITPALDFEALGRNYIESTRPATGRTPRFIDKLPLNYLYAGLIHLALPRAKIICLERHPVDTCYSVYKQLFMDAYPFSYDLEDLAHYFVAYYRLMAHWRAVLPDKIHVVKYEDLVADLERESRRLVDLCDLDWEPACLEFYNHQQAVTTASAVQVRQPVYRSSVARWRHYCEQLEPLVEILESNGVAIQ